MYPILIDIGGKSDNNRVRLGLSLNNSGSRIACRKPYESAYQHAMSTACTTTGRIICHCLRVSEADILTAVDSGAAGCIKTVMKVTEAGGGCTACHCAIKEFLAKRQDALSARRRDRLQPV